MCKGVQYKYARVCRVSAEYAIVYSIVYKGIQCERVCSIVKNKCTLHTGNGIYKVIMVSRIVCETIQGEYPRVY